MRVISDMARDAALARPVPHGLFLQKNAVKLLKHSLEAQPTEGGDVLDFT